MPRIRPSNPTISGTTGADSITGTAGDDIIFLFDGNDTSDAGSGTDSLYGDAGDDSLNGGAGNDYVEGGIGADTIFGASGVDELLGQDGDDQLFGELNEDLLWGGAGRDLLDGGDQADVLYGDDTWSGAAGADTLRGGADSDTLHGGLGSDRLDGGDGFDWASYETAGSTVVVSLGVTGPQDTGSAGRDTLVAIEGLRGSTFADTLGGGRGDDALDGRAGVDRLSGGKGSDRYYVDVRQDVVAEGRRAGADTIFAATDYTMPKNVERLVAAADGVVLTGSRRADELLGRAGVTLKGGDGADTLRGGYWTEGGAGDDLYWVGSWHDEEVKSDAWIGGGRIFDSDGFDVVYTYVELSLSENAGVERIVSLSTFGNWLEGDAGANEIVGNAQTDLLIGGDGDDTLISGGGGDDLSGGTGDDVYVAQAGDRFTEYDGQGYDTIVTLASVALPAHFEALEAGAGAGALQLTGSSGANGIKGGDFNDTLSGGEGNDSLYGGAGDDLLIGGLGVDLFSGGTGRDVFQLQSPGIVSGFVRGEDKIDISAVDADSLLRGDQAFTWLGTAEFNGRAGQLRAYLPPRETDYQILGDVNGDRVADFAILVGPVLLNASDFIL